MNFIDQVNLFEDGDFYCIIPNDLIRTYKNESVNHMTFIVWYMIMKHTSYNYTSYLIPEEILSICKYSMPPAKPKSFYLIMDALKFLQRHGYIDFAVNTDEVSYKTFIKIRVNEAEMIPQSYFMKITKDEFDKIMNCDAKTKKETLVHLYVYILTYASNLELFFQKIDTISKSMNLCNATVMNALQTLVDIGLLNKKRRYNSSSVYTIAS